MSEDTLAAVEAEDQVEEAEAPEEAPEAEEAAPPPPEVVEQARKYGWKPESEWQGKPPAKGFMRPDDFLETPTVQNRILRERLDGLTQAQERAARETAEKLERMERVHRESAERRVQQERERIKADLVKATEEGDTDRVSKLWDEREKLDARPEPKEPEKDAGDEAKAINGWIQSLPADHWWKQDAVMRAASGVLYEQAGLAGVVGADAKLAWVEKRIHERFPQPAKQPQPPRTPKVDGGGLGAPGKSLASKLPDDVRAQAKKDVAAGLYKSMDEWAEVFFA